MFYRLYFILLLMFVSCDIHKEMENVVSIENTTPRKSEKKSTDNGSVKKLPNGQKLKAVLAKLVQDNHRTYLDYTPGVWEALKKTDQDPFNSNKVLLIYGYSDEDDDYKTDRTRNKNNNGGGVGQWNREHVYPKSLGEPNLGTEGPGADAHMLRASDVSLNAKRGNYPFIDGEGHARKINKGWYPGDEWKGDVARIVMYMYVHYGDRTTPQRVAKSKYSYNSDMPDIFLEWNAEDPVSQYEKNRNRILQRIQGNRNPFIDNPYMATKIWGGPRAQNTGINPLHMY